MEVKRKSVGSSDIILTLVFNFSIMSCVSNVYPEIDPSIVGLTGHVIAVRQMAQEYRVFFRKVDEEGGDYLVESSDNM